MNAELDRLLDRFSRELFKTKPNDIEALALAFITRAYELGEAYEPGAEARHYAKSRSDHGDSASESDARRRRPGRGRRGPSQ